MRTVLPWYSRCPGCGFRRSTLLDEAPDRDPIDERRRAAGLSGLRQQNFARIVDVLARLHEPRGTRLLDVGCAHGWFLDAAAARGFQTLGLDPDDAVAAQARARGHAVRSGLFPADAPGELVDVVTFHDTFEHLADAGAALAWCRSHVRPGGLLVINLPTSDGAIYRAAETIASLGVRGPLERLWQKGFPSPHVSYFTATTLARLARAHGFEEVHRESIPAFALRGLWPRLAYDRRLPLPATALLWTGIVALTPVLRALPADTFFGVFRRRPEPPSS
jgi:SAM-dependent methyltransferase